MRYFVLFGVKFLQRALATFQMLGNHEWLAVIVLDSVGLAPGSHCADARLERLESASGSSDFRVLSCLFPNDPSGKPPILADFTIQMTFDVVRRELLTLLPPLPSAGQSQSRAQG